MFNSNLAGILRSFSKEEMKEFGNFISSPFFNKNKNVIAFFNYIKKYHPDFKSEKLENKVILRKLFGGSELNEGFLRIVIFRSYRLAEEFIAYKKFSENEQYKKLILLDYFNENRNEKLFLKKYDELNRSLKDSQFKDHEYFLNTIFTHQQFDKFVENNRFKLRDYEEFRYRSAEEINKILTYYIFILIQHHYTFFFEYDENRKPDIHNDFLNLAVDFVIKNKEKYSDNPLINLQLNEFFLYRDKSESHFFALKDIFKNNFRDYRYIDRYNLHNILQHFCIGKVFNGFPEFKKERFELYETALSQNLTSLYEKDHFNDLLFGNIVQNAVSLSKFDWAERFISDNSYKLDPVVRDVVVNYLKGYISFAEKKYEDSLKYLNVIGNINNISYRTPVKDLILKSLFELGSFSELSYNLEAYKQYIKKNKNSLTDLRYLRIRNFIKYLHKILKLKENHNKKEIEDLTFEIEQNTNTMERLWMLEKLKELKRI